jgi:hypothetical protein
MTAGYIAPLRLAGATLLLVLGSAYDASIARAYGDEGNGWGVGPVIAFGDHGGVSLGFEGGINQLLTLVKLSLGGCYRLSGSETDPRAIHYLAYEPWVAVGGTLGIAVADAEVRGMYGMWEGFPLPILPDEVSGYSHQAWIITLAFGYRMFGSSGQFYVTPKLWRFKTFDFSN